MDKRNECVSDSELDNFEDDGEDYPIPRPRRSKSVDFSPIVRVEEVSRYKQRASKCKYGNMSEIQKLAIRLELNEFKLKEMKVHDQSRSNTLFYDIGKYHTRLRDHFSPKKSFLK
ncbi:Oidioi.mRNA.OKI2018_I69.XSR.g14989.t1.cds [Oikopleura dioica]|uniref:Oidioi.mRNA.OKI2018_I69.XSR.g14989.t1.cds n=1 Tax=Oikopleura dioica TaxID=34765 RepID=A0ABN7SBW5_OIKDI|nr:Oidioi.mRNA.OKI2018_I69.XSR.g14989.t1.cds [Oikopleura dioica]